MGLQFFWGQQMERVRGGGLTECVLVLQGPGPAVDWQTLLGETLNLKILELDEEKDRLVLSNRKNAFNTRRQINVSAASCQNLLPVPSCNTIS